MPPELQVSAFGLNPNDQYGNPPPVLPTWPRGGNVGLYGAIVNYVFTLSNTNTVTQNAAYLHLYTRYNGGDMFGAAQITDPTGYPKWIVPVTTWTANSAPGVKLTETAAGTLAILVDPNTSSRTVAVRFTAGGASSLPVNLVVFRINSTPG